MKYHIKLLFMFLACSLSIYAQKQMAITIDDLPYAYASKLDTEVRDSILIKLADSLRSRNVKATAFVIGGRINKTNQALLEYFATSGNELGNHSYLHISANKISASEYISEVKKCDSAISALPNLTKYYRYPYLQRGDTKSKRDSIVRLINAAGLKIVPVSIDNEEYLYNKYYVDTLAAGDVKAAEEIADTYIDYMVDISNKTDSLSKAISGREIKHILLVHANLLNSRYFGRLIDALKADGWSFISTEEAIKDPIYKEEDLYVGKWGISWLHRIRNRSN